MQDACTRRFTAMPADLQACAAVGGDLLRSERLRFALQAAQLHAPPLVNN